MNDGLNPFALATARKDLYERWRPDAYVRRYAERMWRDATTFTPTDAVGLQRIEALALVADNAWRVEALDAVDPRPGSLSGLAVATDTAARIWDAPTFAWGREILKLAWSLPLPKHIVADDAVRLSARVPLGAVMAPHHPAVSELPRDGRIATVALPCVGNGGAQLNDSDIGLLAGKLTRGALVLGSGWLPGLVYKW